MGKVPRTRRYVGRLTLLVLRPAFRYSAGREAYVLRGVGSHAGPVLRENRRRRQVPITGADRRRTSAA